MVAFVCYTYGYTPEVALKLPAVQFLTLHREARRIEDARHLGTMRDLSAVATVTFGGAKQYEAVLDHFKARGGHGEAIQEEISRAYDAASPESANAVRGFFGGINGR
jgi:hypothetical protein